ncbi:TetR/AcrR family transcriptional regulator [Sciscionella marina]|uniref:TetR/AcrR family transcriptional regulator n=1 Tax=Sciscionella marina TaxID=508770 RepID=UPI00037E49C3|nr:TetR/AcrR family transcriptional regulator [Sciscionella marina]
MTAGATGPGSTRRSRHREERSDRIYRAAIELFVERGFDNATMDEIAERADTARATVFNHFQRKSAFLEEWSRRRRDRALTAVHEEWLDGRPLPEILARYLAELARVSANTRQETVACMGAAIHSTNVFADSELAHQFSRLMAPAAKAGELRSGVDTEQAGMVLASAYLATLSTWIATDPAPFELEQRLLDSLGMILHGTLR